MENTRPPGSRVSKFLLGLDRKPLAMWSAAWVITMLLYGVAWRAGWVYDSLGWVQVTEQYSFGEFIRSEGMNNRSLYHVTQLQLYALTALFGFSPLPWFLLFTAMHAAVTTFFYRLLRGVAGDLRIAHPARLAGGAALLALITPNAQEVVVYKAAYHYLAGIIAIFGILLLGRQALLSGRSRPAIWAVGLFAVTTFTLEIFYTTPWLLLCLATALFWSGRIDAVVYRCGLLRMFAPMLLLFAAHLVLVRVTAGTWVSHGAYKLSGDITPAGWIGRIYGYEHELLFLGRYYPIEVRRAINGLYTQPVAGYALGAVLAAVAVFMLTRFRRASPLFQMWVWLTAGAFITLAIVLHYLLDDILLGLNDRVLYLTSFFHCALIALAVYALARRAIGYVLGIGLIGAVYAFVTFYVAWQWRRSTEVLDALAHDFPTETREPILILNGTTLYKGFPMVQSVDPSDWPDQVRLRSGRNPLGPVHDVSSYNMSHWWDGADVERVGDSTIKVTLKQWATWWWWNTYGATDRDHPLFRLRMTDPGHWYEVDIKPGARNALLLVQDGKRWKKYRLASLPNEVELPAPRD